MTPPIYLSSDTPRWMPRTEADLQAAIDGGLIEESNYFDAKKELVTKGDNKELARDLASFANEGGTLIIGIAEDKAARTFSLAPQSLDGLAEKVNSVARTIPDPPLNVVTAEIPTDTDKAVGYLVVQVPANPQAPHMVDGRYHGRHDKQKHVLTDAEVARLHARRRVAEDDVLALLQREIDQDPLATYGSQSHLFIVAQPLSGQHDMLLKLTSGPGWNMRLAEFIDRAYTTELNDALAGAQIAPDLTDAGNGFRRAGGAARATSNLGEGRIHTPTGSSTDEHVVELQVLEDGGLRLYFTRFSDDSEGEQMLFPAVAVSLTRRLLQLTLAAADEAAYRGGWSLAVGATRLGGRRPWVSNRWSSWGETTRYTQDSYAQPTSAAWAEINESPAAVANRLVGRLLRGLGVEQSFTQALTDPEKPTES
ncbi:AlbA family DNA-binding domain-containing protein [Kitasatospora atroaurantiaca]|uniref:AlbA family DNA-binding domain-containing protein n=1 Tax=Kitasatospora atroaurantiaca TaxID=285545 RepID=UPI00147818BB|nr:ATP-binding protein [Kitasatospora atroaurantiaca]